jgi:hypothetical protein
MSVSRASGWWKGLRAPSLLRLWRQRWIPRLGRNLIWLLLTSCIVHEQVRAVENHRPKLCRGKQRATDQIRPYHQFTNNLILKISYVVCMTAERSEEKTDYLAPATPNLRRTPKGIYLCTYVKNPPFNTISSVLGSWHFFRGFRIKSLIFFFHFVLFEFIYVYFAVPVCK